MEEKERDKGLTDVGVTRGTTKGTWTTKELDLTRPRSEEEDEGKVRVLGTRVEEVP